MNSKDLYRLVREKGTGITTDTRNMRAGDVFFALRGENYNGNKYAGAALDKGAAFAVIDDKQYSTGNTVLVDNTLLALQGIARMHRLEISIPVIAVTGSNGKTTTKELISKVLSEAYRVHSTEGNYNNHIGVPLTVLGADSSTEIMVVEMGANHPGEIAGLCEIASPGFGVITNIGKAHLEGFGSPDGIVRAKTELYRFLKDNGGKAFCNKQDKLLIKLADGMDLEIIYYNDPACIISIGDSDSSKGISFEVKLGEDHYEINSTLAGSYNITNIMAALAVAMHFNIEPGKAVEAINSYTPDNNRSQIKNTGRNIVLCDAYNANPGSMSAALDEFLAGQKGPKTVILGDMFELGSYAVDEHRLIVNILKKAENTRVILVGPLFAEAAGESDFMLCRNTDVLIKYLETNPLKDNFVLVKGSRGMELEKIYPLL